MLRKIRIIIAAAVFVPITLLFLDFTGTLHAWFGWLAKIQFLPAVLAMNFAVTAVLVILTLVFGRVYCSVICPLGIMQDIISWIHGRTKRKNRFRFSWSPAKNRLRYSILAIFIAALMAGFTSFAALLAPYSSYGRIAGNLFAPIYAWGNNLLAWIAERAGSYAFYGTEVWLKSLPTFIIAAVTFVILFILAWKNGRTYCNTICPVGSILGLLSRFSLFRLTIDTDKCRNCGLCGRQCKAACIDTKEHVIDHSRCVACFDCIDVCKDGAIKYRIAWKPKDKRAGMPANDSGCTNGNEGTGMMKADGGKAAPADRVNGRRTFLATSAIALAATAMKAQEKKVDGGLAVIEDKKIPARKTPLKPAGSLSLAHFTQHCTACQLCVSVCPNQVLRPSGALLTLMQPEMSFERGWCRPECTKCSEVCPSGPITPVTREEKSSIRTGHAVVIHRNCIVNTDGVSCGNCAKHCPTGAIMMVPNRRHGHGGGGNDGAGHGRHHGNAGSADEGTAPLIPIVNEEKCIGCGACEYLCPARPFSAIYVEGYEVHDYI